MTDPNEFDDELLKNILTQAEPKITSPDFEDRLMSKIRLQSSQENEVSMILNRAFTFLLAGVILSLSLIIHLLVFWDHIYGLNAKTISIISFSLLGAILYFNLDKFKYWKSKYSASL